VGAALLASEEDVVSRAAFVVLGIVTFRAWGCGSALLCKSIDVGSVMGMLLKRR
jgi:hypothetical protein